MVGNMKPTHIFAEYVEPKAMEQFEDAMVQPFVVQGALMPDAHAGYTLPIGAVVSTKDVVVPSYVGYDIGCGMCAAPVMADKDLIAEKAAAICRKIYDTVPVGFHHHTTYRELGANLAYLERTSMLQTLLQERKGAMQLGTLGSGNHFIEIGYDETEQLWIIVHSGSRGIGHDCAATYMKLASGTNKAKEGHYPLEVDSPEGKNYITDLHFCLEFALENRLRIIQQVDTILRQENWGYIETATESLINRNHNHAELKDGLWIHRKGATHAELGMMGVIPGNMRDGSFIVRGLGNPDSLWSSSHGAGRIMGRKEAQRTFGLEAFAETMKGIEAKVQWSTLDESPMAYKNIFEVMALQKSLVEVVHHVRPILNIKG